MLFLFDTTGSMGGVISEAQAAARDIMNGIRSNASGTQFGVANYKDYPSYYNYPGYSNYYGGAGDYPWRVDATMGATDDVVAAAIDALSADGGSDWPESLTRALHESSASIAWREATGRVVVLFADAPPHDLDFHGNTGGDPGPDGAAMTGDDLDFESTVHGLAANGTKVVVIDSGSGASEVYFRFIANATGGAYEVLETGDLAPTVIRLVSGLIECEGGFDARGVGIELRASDEPIVRAPVASVHDPANWTFAHHELGPAVVTGVAFDADGALDFPTPETLAGFARASTTAAVVEVPGIVRAEGVHIEAHSVVDALGAESWSSVRFARLLVGGAEVDVSTLRGPETLTVPGIATVHVHHATDMGDGVANANLTAYALRVVLHATGAELLLVGASAEVGRDVNAREPEAPTPPLAGLVGGGAA